MRLNIKPVDGVSVACVITVPIKTALNLTEVCRKENDAVAEFLSHPRPLPDDPKVAGEWCWAAPTIGRPYPVLRFVGAILTPVEYPVSNKLLDLLCALLLDLDGRHPLDLRRAAAEIHIGAEKYQLTEKQRELA